MYITNVRLQRVRCFENLSLDFEGRGESALIVGNNGDGKTTLLRSIAMGLCDESSAAALLRELPGEFVRHGEDDAVIEITLRNKNASYKIQTTVTSLPAFERVKQKLWRHKGRIKDSLDQDTFPWRSIFVSAYGAGPRTKGIADFNYYTAVDAVYTLFRYDEPLQNPELALRRLADRARAKEKKDPRAAEARADDALNNLRELLRGILNLRPRDKVYLTPKGIEVRGSWGREELASLGDGYKATITWVLDLISWWMLHRKSLDPKKMSGIVLLDEIEQHLHPRWQVQVMRLIRKAFPKVQFIAATHSPLVVSGCEDLPVHILNGGQYQVRRQVYGWRAEDVYREILGIPTSRPEAFTQFIEEYEKLHLKELRTELSPNEKARMEELRKRVKTLPSGDPVVLTKELINLTKDLKRNKIKSKGKG